MKLSQWLKFNPAKLIQILKGKNSTPMDVTSDSKKMCAESLNNQVLRTMRQSTVLDFETSRRYANTQKSYNYITGLEDAINPTSLEVKDPIPCASNVCICEDVSDFKMRVMRTMTIEDALNRAKAHDIVEVIATHLTHGKITNTIIVEIANKNVAINITYSSNVLFEEIECATCGTRIGWCTEIGGRAFSIAPGQYIHGLIDKEIVKHVENENERVRLKLLDAQMMEAKRNHHINSFKYKNII